VSGALLGRMTPPTSPGGLASALAAGDPSLRLRAALEAGSRADPGLLDALIDRCAVEPDFYVRDMLTWALTRLPHPAVLDRLRLELGSTRPQARSQALHTLSKIGDARTWEWITPELLGDDDDEVARSAWRAAVVLVPSGSRESVAGQLIGQLGRGGRDLQLSLSRTLISLGEAIVPLLDAAVTQRDAVAATHARATMALMDEPELGFDAAIHEARRVAALGPQAG